MNRFEGLIHGLVIIETRYEESSCSKEILKINFVQYLKDNIKSYTLSLFQFIR